MAALLGASACARLQAGTTLTCPRAVFLGGTERLTQFPPGAERRPEAAVAEIQLVDLLYNCRFNRERTVATVNFSILAERRATAAAGSIVVPFFVAVTDAEGAILAKHPFTSRLDFPTGIAAVTAREEIEETIPLSAGQRAVAFEILVGLQLTPAELEYNLAGAR